MKDDECFKNSEIVENVPRSANNVCVIEKGRGRGESKDMKRKEKITEKVTERDGEKETRGKKVILK